MIVNESRSFEFNGHKYSHGNGHYYRDAEETIKEEYFYASKFSKDTVQDDMPLNENKILLETDNLSLDTFEDRRGIGLIINGQRYVYLIKGREKNDILRTFNKMRYYSDGRALAWLKKQTNNDYIKV